MQAEIATIIGQLRESYEGSPWFGRNIKALLGEVDEGLAFQKINDQHSILELLYHMSLWREFTISRLEPSDKDLPYFEENDWQVLNHEDKSLWKKGLDKLQQTQDELLHVLQLQDDTILERIVSGREYNFRKLLYGIVQHDIYHTGQIAYITKALKGQ